MTPPTVTPPPGTPPPPPAGPPGGPPPTRRLHRSRSDRVVGGVAGGLGEHFGLDPVLFRVLFAVATFFGGFGLVAYAVLWFAVPEAGDTTTSPVDRLGAWLRAHNVPLWLAGIVAVGAFWVFVGGFGGFGFHGFFFPGAALVGVALLVVAFSRRGATTATPPPPPGPGEGAPFPGAPGADRPTVLLTKPLGPDATDERPMDAWYHAARERGRQRRRRARPLFLATLAALVVGLGTVVVVDAVSGVALPVYGIVGATVALLGLVAGLLARRPAFSLTWFLVPSLVWLAAFAGTHTSFRDGAGDVAYRPTSAADLGGDHRLAFGRLTLDLRGVYAATATSDGPAQVTLRVGAGVARVLVPDDAQVTVVSEVRSGAVVVDGEDDRSGRGDGSGWRAHVRIPAPGGDGPRLLVVLQVTDGVAVIDHVGG